MHETCEEKDGGLIGKSDCTEKEKGDEQERTGGKGAGETTNRRGGKNDGENQGRQKSSAQKMKGKKHKEKNRTNGARYSVNWSGRNRGKEKKETFRT